MSFICIAVSVIKHHACSYGASLGDCVPCYWRPQCHSVDSACINTSASVCKCCTVTGKKIKTEGKKLQWLSQVDEERQYR